MLIKAYVKSTIPTMSLELNPVTVMPFMRGGYNRLNAVGLDCLAAYQQVNEVSFFPSKLFRVRKVLPLTASASPEEGTGWLTPERRSRDKLRELRFSEASFGLDDAAINQITGSNQRHEDRLPFMAPEPPPSMNQGCNFKVPDYFSHRTNKCAASSARRRRGSEDIPAGQDNQPNSPERSRSKTDEPFRLLPKAPPFVQAF